MSHSKCSKNHQLMQYSKISKNLQINTLFLKYTMLKFTVTRYLQSAYYKIFFWLNVECYGFLRWYSSMFQDHCPQILKPQFARDGGYVGDGPIAWSSCSSDLSHLDFRIWCHLKSQYVVAIKKCESVTRTYWREM